MQALAVITIRHALILSQQDQENEIQSSVGTKGREENGPEEEKKIVERSFPKKTDGEEEGNFNP